MTSINPGPQVAGDRREVDHQKLGPILLIASSPVLADTYGSMKSYA